MGTFSERCTADRLMRLALNTSGTFFPFDGKGSLLCPASFVLDVAGFCHTVHTSYTSTPGFLMLAIAARKHPRPLRVNLTEIASINVFIRRAADSLAKQTDQTFIIGSRSASKFHKSSLIGCHKVSPQPIACRFRLDQRPTHC